MNEKTIREQKLLSCTALNKEQQLELQLIKLKNTKSNCEYHSSIDDAIKKIFLDMQPYSMYSYDQLLDMGYTVDEIVKKTVSLSEDAITNYSTDKNEASYWLDHRANSPSLFKCAMYAGIILGHFSVTPVLVAEAEEFMRGERTEIQFTIVSKVDILTTKHCLYISSVVVHKLFRNTLMSTKLIRQGYRLIKYHLATNSNACGYFAEAYSPQGRKLCELFGMKNVNGNMYSKKI